jgi:dTDP-4-dehydrorhamnose 3,5-epimerase
MNRMPQSEGEKIEAQGLTVLVATPIDDLWLVQRKRNYDERGSLERLFSAEQLASAGVPFKVIHVNLTRTVHSGTVKGLHMQGQPHAEAKMVTCISGRIFDVAVDLRHDSLTYGQWFGVELSPDKPESLLIPEGFAHGMQCLEPNSIVHYAHSAAYSPAAETGINPLDPDVAIAWPLAPRYVSSRDRSLSGLNDLGEVAR